MKFRGNPSSGIGTDTRGQWIGGTDNKETNGRFWRLDADAPEISLVWVSHVTSDVDLMTVWKLTERRFRYLMNTNHYC